MPDSASVQALFLRGQPLMALSQRKPASPRSGTSASRDSTSNSRKTPLLQPRRGDRSISPGVRPSLPLILPSLPCRHSLFDVSLLIAPGTAPQLILVWPRSLTGAEPPISARLTLLSVAAQSKHSGQVRRTYEIPPNQPTTWVLATSMRSAKKQRCLFVLWSAHHRRYQVPPASYPTAMREISSWPTQSFSRVLPPSSTSLPLE